MRILFMHHFPLGLGEAGQLVQQWARALVAAGHEARLLIIDDQTLGNESPAVDRIVCRAGDLKADLSFELPRFGTPQGDRQQSAFTTLSDRQLAQYRDQVRRRLDAEIDRFDPHVIHAQHIWVQGQLALETGVPYVLNGWGPELIDYERDERYRSLADQAAENAGRILVPHESILRRVAETFPIAADRVLVMSAELNLGDGPVTSSEGAAASEQLIAIYRSVLEERFGPKRDASSP
jgi:hypothetical protein